MIVRITGPAQRQLNRIEAWWLANRDKAPGRFDQELAVAKEFWRPRLTSHRNMLRAAVA